MSPNEHADSTIGGNGGTGQPEPKGAQATSKGDTRVNARQKLIDLADRFITLLDEIPRAGLVNAFLFAPSISDPAPLCPHCGNPLPSSAHYCGKCGKQLDVTANKDNTAQPVANTPEAAEKTKAPPTPGAPLQDIVNQSLQTYFRIAAHIWELSAADQLEKLAGKDDSMATLEALEKHLMSLEQTCKEAKQSPNARGSWFWRQRAGLYRRSLLEWKRCLGDSPRAMLQDPARGGRVLYRAYGRVGLASLNAYDYLMIKSLQWLALVGPLWPLSFILTEVSFIRQGQGDSFLAILTVLGITLLGAGYIFWLSGRELSLPAMAGYILAKRQATFQPIPSVPHSLGKHSKLLRKMLLYWLRVGGLLPVCILAIGTSLLFLAFLGLLLSESPIAAILDSSDFLFLLIPVSLGILILIALPFTVTIQVQMFRELMDHPTRPPEARRYSVRPALRVLTSHALILVLLAFAICNLLGLLGDFLPLPLPISYRQVIYAGLPLLLYALLIELPYRLGMRRWKNNRLSELTTTRKKIEQRLDSAQPGAYPAGYTIQDDYSHWQYYRTQESEVNDIPDWSFSANRGGIFSLTILVGSFLIEHLDLLQKILSPTEHLH